MFTITESCDVYDGLRLRAIVATFWTSTFRLQSGIIQMLLIFNNYFD
ncbi:hypothetical protein LC586_09180 [Nostoc sp. CHAB 5714]|uniref:Uncharacterized protein n=1 Tax=Nostoc favosum CHAB5714 TaxID=2780399 RepID=A0ABS8I693_9NOSO|nr:hypothetical protein [Nostoc favosum CHAB5714]